MVEMIPYAEVQKAIEALGRIHNRRMAELQRELAAVKKQLASKPAKKAAKKTPKKVPAKAPARPIGAASRGYLKRIV